MSYFERICWRWNNLNSEIETRAEKLSSNRYVRIKYEDVISNDKSTLSHLFDAIGLAAPHDKVPRFDVHINKSVKSDDEFITESSDEQKEILERHCGVRMRQYGYS